MAAIVVTLFNFFNTLFGTLSLRSCTSWVSWITFLCRFFFCHVFTVRLRLHKSLQIPLLSFISPSPNHWSSMQKQCRSKTFRTTYCIICRNEELWPVKSAFIYLTHSKPISHFVSLSRNADLTCSQHVGKFGVWDEPLGFVLCNPVSLRCLIDVFWKSLMFLDCTRRWSSPLRPSTLCFISSLLMASIWTSVGRLCIGGPAGYLEASRCFFNI